MALNSIRPRRAPFLPFLLTITLFCLSNTHIIFVNSDPRHSFCSIAAMVETSPPRKKARPSPLTNFPLTDLPQEVQGWIIELACRLPFMSSASFSSPDSSHPGEGLPVPFAADSFDSKPTHFDIDSPATLSLALVSRSFHSQVDQVLYSHIRITRPSALLALQRTLVARPQLGRIIKSLWVGPDDQLETNWWPLQKEDTRGLDDGAPIAWLSSSLSWLHEGHLIPLWIRQARWPVQTFRSPGDCRGTAIHNALAAAQKALNVDLNFTRWNHSKTRIEEASATWRDGSRHLPD